MLWVLFYFGPKIKSRLNVLTMGTEVGNEGIVQRTVIFLMIIHAGYKETSWPRECGSQLPPWNKV